MKTWRLSLLLVILVGCVGAWLWFSWLERSYQNLEKPYHLIEDGLFVGKAVRQPPPGTKAVVNLCGLQDAYEVEACLWEPILEGGKVPDLEWLQRVVAFIDTQRKAGNTTYIHCMAGVNRSGMVVTAYLMHKHGWSRDEALAFVQSKRPLIGPDPSLMELLAEWERSLKDRHR